MAWYTHVVWCGEIKVMDAVTLSNIPTLSVCLQNEQFYSSIVQHNIFFRFSLAAYHCFVLGCTNGECRLLRWKCSASEVYRDWVSCLIHYLNELIDTDEQCHLFYIVMSFQNSIENFHYLVQSCHITILYTDIYCMILRL